MGCQNSTTLPDCQGVDAQKAGAQGTQGRPKGAKLLDNYALGKVLGQGAFGVVYKCTRKGTQEVFAVKMIDQVETPLATIKEEERMLFKLSHSTCIKLHEVYYEKVFVCMVLDLYPGGDLIQGMMAHWKSKGMVPIPNVRFLSAQMSSAIAWIHTKRCVHCDVKGDNFMMGVPLVENPNQRIYLSDFGTVKELKEGQRSNQKCGTKNYWSPEFYKLDYGLKVDCWAVGVVMFGLVTGKFPFKGEDDVKNKKLSIPKRCPDEGADLILKMLERDEQKRIDCADSLKHSFLANEKDSVDDGGVSEKPDTSVKAEMKDVGANAGIAQRRLELVDRLQHHGDRKSSGSQEIKRVLEKQYTVLDPSTERTLSFEWWLDSSTSSLLAALSDAKPTQAGNFTNKEITEEIVKDQLTSHNVAIDGFGKGQAVKFSDFVTELQDGASRLLLDATKHRHIVRAQDIVMLKVYGVSADGKKRLLVDITQGMSEGRTTAHPALPQNVKLPHESSVETASRLLKQMIGASELGVSWSVYAVESFEESFNSPQFPGMITVYRKEIIMGEVALGQSGETLGKVGLPKSTEFTHNDGTRTRNFAWLSEAHCQSKKVLFQKPPNTDFSALVPPPIGLEEEELQAFLVRNNVDTSQWGTGTYKTLQDFSDELMKGESSLHPQGGRVRRVVDIVVMDLVRADTKDRLIEASESFRQNVQELKRLPAVKRRSDEHLMIAARRMVTKYLSLPDNAVKLDMQDVRVIEEEQESKAFFGLSTLYRKTVMKAVVNP